LTAEQVTALDSASEQAPIYPYWHQQQFPERNPPPVPRYSDKIGTNPTD
jgi:hypothetical protein